MKNTHGWGWLIAGVLALGLNGVYLDGGASWARRVATQAVDSIAQRTGPILALAAGRADLFMAKTEKTVGRAQMAHCQIANAMARVRSRVAQSQMTYNSITPNLFTQSQMQSREFEIMSAREEAALGRLEANRAQIEARIARVRFAPVAFEMEKIPVACPRVRVDIPRVMIPKFPSVRIPAPALHRDGLGAGPV